ncbi:MAG: hypothetical protein WAV27_03290 [Xanthobacteraceae bacterium]
MFTGVFLWILDIGEGRTWHVKSGTRHSTRGKPAADYALANAGHDTRRIQDWLGHRSIQHTVRYSELSAAPFKDFWRLTYGAANAYQRLSGA